MNLGSRCEKMLDNRTQCPNTALPGSDFCALHTESKVSLDTPQINDPNAPVVSTSETKETKTDWGRNE